ncbi:MAG: DUF2184 domain-containing protein, partial [Burkholderiales bacterium 21-58-4]
MANMFNSVTKVDPSFSEPDAILTTAQASGFMDLLAGRKPRVKLGNEDLFVYIPRVDIRTPIAAGQAAFNMLPSPTITTDYISTASYLLRTRAEFDHHDVNNAARWNVSLPQALTLAMRQGIFQYARTMCLYGVNAANFEGIINTSGATAVTLPPDSYGNTTIRTYDAGELALQMLQYIQNTLTSTFQLGQAIRVQMLGPQRILGQMQLTNIVQVTSYQRPGSGTATTAQVIQTVAKEFGYEIEYAYDDTLIGKGAGGTDAVIINIPEIRIPEMANINTNVFDTLQPNMKAT